MDMLVYLMVALVFSAFFSGMEAAFDSVDKLRLEMECKQGVASRILPYFFRRSNMFVSAMWAGGIISLVFYGIFAGEMMAEYLSSQGLSTLWLQWPVQVGVAMLVYLAMGKFLPVLLFKSASNLMLRVLSVPALVCYVLLWPIAKLFSVVSGVLLRMFGLKVNKEVQAQAFGKMDLDSFVESSIKNAENEEKLDAEVKIFQNALDFSNIKIRDCMVPRTEIVSVDSNDSLEELKSLFVESGISKIIVCDGGIDHVVGYIHSSEMFRSPARWQDCVKPVPIVPETMQAHKLMKHFMQQKKTIAVVVDEFGGTSGLVSLEDLVEEIFGDIEDEHDNTSYVCKQVDAREYVLSARLEIEKVNETFVLDLPESDEYQTVGGLILNHCQRFPKLNETVVIGHLQFKIVKVSATKIELVRLKVMD